VPDFPFTGGGLTALPGLYSQYIRVVPDYTINNSNNLFLNIAIEQGLFGLMGFSCILLVSFWSVKTSQFDGVFRWAILAALFVMVITGLAADPFYGGRGTPLLLILPGLAIAVARGEGKSEDEVPRTQAASSARVWRAIILGGLLLITLLVFSFRTPLVAQWYANLGALQMAKYELVDFPTGEWDERQDLELLRPSYDYFAQSIELNPLNFTSQHRMGLLAMRGRDFKAAVSHLEVAYSVDPEHRGLRKVLGYAYIWTGQFEKSVPLMIDIPWIKDEFRSYRKWWQAHGRGDLSTRSDRMLEIFNRIESESAP
jgi:tetratricopeptide (TPR) repeat protein